MIKIRKASIEDIDSNKALFVAEVESRLNPKLLLLQSGIATSCGVYVKVTIFDRIESYRYLVK